MTMWNPADALADHIWAKHITPAFTMWETDDEYAYAQYLINTIAATHPTPTHTPDCLLNQPDGECTCNQSAHRKTT